MLIEKQTQTQTALKAYQEKLEESATASDLDRYHVTDETLKFNNGASDSDTRRSTGS